MAETTLKDWVNSWREDVDTLKRAVSAEKASKDLRRQAAAALNYLVSRMDLIPDWEPVIGMLDDVMVARVCAAAAMRSGEEGLDERTSMELSRLADQEDLIQEILGGDLFRKLRTYCDQLADQSVRGRTPSVVVSDAKMRAELFADVEDAVKKAKLAKITDPADTAAKLKRYLSAKLKTS